jgi:hypothetical protein
MKTNFEMAKEAGLRDSVNLERFAAIVRADEKERIIKVIESMGTWAHINEVIDEVRRQS